MDAPTFVAEDAASIISDMKTYIENVTGQVLSDADIEMELINAFAYREKNLRVSINDTGRQCLVPFATGTALDALGALVGVTRLSAQGALCTIQLQTVAVHPDITFPDSIRFQSEDGAYIFITTQPVYIPAELTTATVTAICTTTGAAGNGYGAGQISVILDPKAYLSSGANIDTTNGGADEESDDTLRSRIILAPNSFSVAGPKEAYEYFAKSANANIVAVDVSSPSPGLVQICPLLSGGVIPGQEVLDEVMSVCNDDKVRPLTDTVSVIAPEQVDYSIDIALVLYDGADDDSVVSTVTGALNGYVSDRKNLLGADVIRAQLTGLSNISGQVYNINVNSPATDIIVGNTQFANCTGVNVTVTGYNGG